VASARIADHIGRVLGGRYRLLAAIGTGASAHVFLADDVRLGRRVAVKVLHPALADDAAFLRRFRAEARAVAALSHPHVLAVYDWGEEPDGPFLVTEFLSGGSLRAMLDRGHRLSLSQALLVGLETARGLDYAHRRGLVHRDIKPANLLFDDDGHVRVADFGLARALAEAAWTEPSGAVLGTARYIAPEQVRDTALDGKADVYSLAVVLVEAVTGRVPFAADTTLGTIMSRLDRPLEVPAELGPLAPVLARAGQPEPAKRPDAMAFGTALQGIASTLPSPEPLPLAGASVFDEVAVVLDRDPTVIGVAAASEPTVASSPPDDAAGPTTLVPTAAPTPAPVPASAPTAAVDVVPEGAERRRRRRWPWVLLLALLAAAGAVIAAVALVQAQVPTHPVPNVSNRPEPDARAALAPLGLRSRVEHKFVDGTAEGQVVSQSPAPGTRLKEGKTVSLVVSRGPTPVDPPDLSSFSHDEARAKLEETGLKIGTVTAQYDEVAPAGRVLDWTPRAGTRKGDAVDLVVSQGPAPRAIPDVSGKTYDQARQALADVGLQAARVDVLHDDVPQDRAVGTRPPWGTTVDRGSTVTIVISKGQPEVPRLNGMNASQARAALEANELKLGQVFGPSGGDVFLSTPREGTRVKRGTSVDIYVM
jgi:beta-lactam-binding protein with PASTA domain/tRNA A-37 threonylcarbamoyl transferase component Bud32